MRMWLSAFAVLFLASEAFAQQGPRTRVDLSSQPSGAVVFVDGSNCGSTPATLFDMLPGRHLVKLQLDGYVDSYRYVTVEEGIPVQLSEVLRPEKGLLLVKSVPDACEINIDGYSVGLTPRLITTLDAKDPHKMTLSKAGYRSAAFDIRLDGRKPVVRNETLILDSGIIHVITEPAGADVVINGIHRGKTPIAVREVPKGSASVKISLPGFKDVLISDIAINAGDEQTISRVLEGLPGTLSLSSVPDGARFYLNGEFRGKGPVDLLSLSPGAYEVRAELDGYSTVTRTVEVGKGSAAREEFRLSNVMGRLEIRSSPPGAQVFVDGRLIATTSSSYEDAEFSDVLSVENLVEGEHVLTVRKDGFAEQTRHPKIRSKKTSQANVRLRRVFKPDIEITTETGTYKGILVGNTQDYVTVEVKLGIQRTFPRTDIRSIRVLEK